MKWKDLFDRVALVSLATTGVESDAEVIGVALRKLTKDSVESRTLFRQVDTDRLEPSMPYHGVTPDRICADAVDDDAFASQLATELFGYDVLTYNPSWAEPKLASYVPAVHVMDVSKLIWLMASPVGLYPEEALSLETLEQKAGQTTRGRLSVRKALRAAGVEPQVADESELPMEHALSVVQEALEKLWDAEIPIVGSAPEQA